MFTEKRPIDDMFQDGLNLHAFAKAALANKVDKIMDSLLARELLEFRMSRNITSTNKRNVEEPLVSIIEIGVICSYEALIDRTDITKVSTTLQGI